MHRSLHIEEVVRLIASFCNGKTHQAQLNMALTCRSFYEPAMDALWRDLEQDIEPLLLLLPAYTLQRDEVMGWMIIKAPRPDEWHRFRHHARRVRSLSIYDDEPFRVNCAALDKLCRLYSEPFPLPNLRRFSCDDGAYFYDSWESFLPPTLEEASMIQFDEYNAAAFSDALGRCPNLKRVYFEPAKNPWNIDQKFVQSFMNSALRSLRSLTVVRVGTLLPATIRHLASLPALKDIELAFDTSNDYEDLLGGFPGDLPPFLSLQTLHITAPATSIKSLLHLLNTTRPVQLKTCRIFFGCKDEPSSKPLASALEAAQDRYINKVAGALSRLPSLECLRLSVDGDHCRSSELVFGADTLGQLLRLPGVRTLDLGRHPVALQTDDVKRILEAWPGIERLELGQCCDASFSSMPVEDLRIFAACPQLQRLGVMLCGDIDMRALAKRPRPKQSSSRLQILFIGDSVVRNPAHLAAFVSGVFPQANVQASDVKYGIKTEKPLPEVNKLLLLFAKAERMERSRAFGSLRPHYGKETRCPYSAWSVRDLIKGGMAVEEED